MSNAFDLFGDASSRLTYAPHFPLPRSISQVKATATSKPRLLNRVITKSLHVIIETKKQNTLNIKLNNDKKNELVDKVMIDDSRLFDELNSVLSNLSDSTIQTMIQSARAPIASFTVESLIELDDRCQFCVTSIERTPTSFASNSRSSPRQMFLPFVDLSCSLSGAAFVEFVLWRRRSCELRAKCWAFDDSIEGATPQRWSPVAQGQIKNIERVKTNVKSIDHDDQFVVAMMKEAERVKQICVAVQTSSRGEGVRLVTSATSNDQQHDVVRFLLALSASCRVLSEGGAFVFHFVEFDSRSAFARSVLVYLQSCFVNVSVCRTTQRCVARSSNDMSLQQRVVKCSPAFVVATGFRHDRLIATFQSTNKATIADQLEAVAIESSKQHCVDAAFVEPLSDDDQSINVALRSLLHSVLIDRVRICAAHCPVNKFSPLASVR